MTTATAAPVRVTLYGPGGRFDTGVWGATTPAALVGDARVRPYLGLEGDEPSVLLTPAGRVLEGSVPLVDQGIRDGAALVAVATARAREDPVPRRTRRSARSRPERVPRSPGALVVGLVGAVGAAVMASTVGGPVLVAACSLLLVTALVGAVAAPADSWGDLCRLLSPGAAGAATWAAVTGPGPGAMHLALTAGAVSAAVTAAVARNGSRGREAADGLLVALVVTSGTAVLLGVGMLLDMPLRAAAPLAAGVAVVALRLLPTYVVDVPDEALLELDRLSVTAWSAHDRRRRRGWRRLHAGDVSGLLSRARRIYRAAVVWTTLVATVGALGTVADRGADVAPYGSLLLVGCVGVVLPLTARTVRDDVGAAALRLGGGVVTLALLVGVVVVTSDLGRALAVGLAVVAGTCAVFAAVALGRGWRSVRWGRLADLVEGLGSALLLPATLVAAGGVEWVRQVVS